MIFHTRNILEYKIGLNGVHLSMQFLGIFSCSEGTYVKRDIMIHYYDKILDRKISIPISNTDFRGTVSIIEKYL
jgi:hypothetical protein